MKVLNDIGFNNLLSELKNVHPNSRTYVDEYEVDTDNRVRLIFERKCKSLHVEHEHYVKSKKLPFQRQYEKIKKIAEKFEILEKDIKWKFIHNAGDKLQCDIKVTFHIECRRENKKEMRIHKIDKLLAA